MLPLVVPALCWAILNVLVDLSVAGVNELHSTNDWWKNTVIYQIYPRSFQDSDGNGVGDIRGIISRLDYFNYLNVGAIWLSPVYKSPMVDHGYDIEDHVDIDPIFGTLADFDELITAAHNRGIRVIMDYIPNHTSDKSKWFIESRRGGSDNEYSDFYVWNDGILLENGTRVPPNNWVSCFTGPAWTWDSLRGQFYLHQFCPEQPDLNYRNPRVKEEMQKVLQFWLDRGVDGFRVDAIATMFESEDFSLNEQPYENTTAQEYEEFYLNHTYTRNLPEIHDVVREWRQLFNRHYDKTGKYTFMMVEVYEATDISVKYYESGADMPLNMLLIGATPDCYATCYKSLINEWLSSTPDGKWPNFVIGNHDRKRVSVRKGKQFINALNILLLTLPGTPTTYYGEEIGMDEIEVSYEDTQDPWGKRLGPDLYQAASRDPCRSPIQWDDSLNSGFSSAAKTWLPVNSDYRVNNVELQKSSTNSPLEIYRFVAHLCQVSAAFHTEHLMFLPGNDNVLAFVRYNPNETTQTTPSYLVAINLGLDETLGVGTEEVIVSGVAYSNGLLELDSASGPRIDALPVKLSLKDIRLVSGQAVILRLVNDEKVEL